jgi:hypothetical protein
MLGKALEWPEVAWVYCEVFFLNSFLAFRLCMGHLFGHSQVPSLSLQLDVFIGFQNRHSARANKLFSQRRVVDGCVGD